MGAGLTALLGRLRLLCWCADGGAVHAPVDALDAIEAVARAGRDQRADVFAKHHSRLVDG
ncbi:MAG TPA: hypothetical protein VGJ53_00810 [Micromonosporaceae bacterium]|jgi:hypothetical protein